jgi:hypothetical protein
MLLSIHIALSILIWIICVPSFSGENENWSQKHPEWIFCDDFEDTSALVKPGRYFEYNNNDGDFIRMNGIGVNGSFGMRVRFQKGEVDAGNLKVAFGRNPVAYMNKQRILPEENFREIYYRMYLKMEKNWSGNPAKLSRATCFTNAADWRQAMIAHLWSDDKEHLLIDPAGCIDNDGNVRCTQYNDFDQLSWLGNQAGKTPLFSTDNSNRWFCIEAHVKLNDPGVSNGIQEFWINGNLEARKTGLNFIGTYTDYAINAVYFENYWNSGSVKLQERYFDNIVISKSPIGPYTEALRSVPHHFVNSSPGNFSKKQLFYEAIDLRGRIIMRTTISNTNSSLLQNLPTILPGKGVFLFKIQDVTTGKLLNRSFRAIGIE